MAETKSTQLIFLLSCSSRVRLRAFRIPGLGLGFGFGRPWVTKGKCMWFALGFQVYSARAMGCSRQAWHLRFLLRRRACRVTFTCLRITMRTRLVQESKRARSMRDWRVSYILLPSPTRRIHTQRMAGTGRSVEDALPAQHHQHGDEAEDCQIRKARVPPDRLIRAAALHLTHKLGAHVGGDARCDLHVNFTRLPDLREVSRQAELHRSLERLDESLLVTHVRCQHEIADDLLLHVEVAGRSGIASL
mmetsp:Transcript_10022/g.29628  ORF Transcript_10022/g.29628 Transcript_10022/m.29628 type:complete len:247 (-) Transcript_10022:591-1331(-)